MRKGTHTGWADHVVSVEQHDCLFGGGDNRACRDSALSYFDDCAFRRLQLNTQFGPD